MAKYIDWCCSLPCDVKSGTQVKMSVTLYSRQRDRSNFRPLYIEVRDPGQISSYCVFKSETQIKLPTTLNLREAGQTPNHFILKSGQARSNFRLLYIYKNPTGELQVTQVKMPVTQYSSQRPRSNSRPFYTEVRETGQISYFFVFKSETKVKFSVTVYSSQRSRSKSQTILTSVRNSGQTPNHVILKSERLAKLLLSLYLSQRPRSNSQTPFTEVRDPGQTPSHFILKTERQTKLPNTLCLTFWQEIRGSLGKGPQLP